MKIFKIWAILIVSFGNKLKWNGWCEAWIVQTDMSNKCWFENFSSIYIYQFVIYLTTLKMSQCTRFWPTLRHHSCICLVGLRKTNKKLNQDSRCADDDSNQTPPESQNLKLYRLSQCGLVKTGLADLDVKVNSTYVISIRAWDVCRELRDEFQSS